MKPLKSIFKFQLKNAVNKWSILVFVVIAAILQIFLQFENSNYSDIIENKETFQRQEHQKASRYIHYGQYGTDGIMIMFIPHSNCILFYDSKFEILLCRVNSTFIHNCYTPQKGRGYFSKRSHFLNFSILLFLFGVLASIIYGKDTTVKKDYLRFISILSSPGKALWLTILSRLIILFISGLALFEISILPLLLFNGINIYSTSFPNLLIFILSLLFFFSIGALIGLLKKQIIRTLMAIAAFFFLAMLIPLGMSFYAEISANDLPSLIEFNFKNFSVVMQEEEKWKEKYGSPKSKEDSSEEEIKEYEYIMRKMKKIFRDNEERLKKQALKKIKQNQSLASFFPSLFYFSVCESSSSICVISQIEFNTYCQEKKEEFVDFIIKKEFPEDEEPSQKTDKKDSKKIEIENFLKGDEDLFFSKPKLPYNFWLGVFLALFYSILLLLLSFRILNRRLKIPKPKASYQITFEKGKGNVLFAHCENDSIKADIFNHYQNQENTLCLEKIDVSHFQFHGVKVGELFNHICRVSGTDEKKAIKNLGYMGIRDLSIFKPDEETILKIYTAVRTAGEYDLIVLDDFLKKESKQFESGVIKLLLTLVKSGKNIIYLSTESYDVVGDIDDNIKIDKFLSLPIDLNVVILR